MNSPNINSCKRAARKFASGKQTVTVSEVQEFVGENWGKWVKRQEKSQPGVSAAEHYSDLYEGVVEELKAMGVAVIDG